jgi:hypothetical protein
LGRHKVCPCIPPPGVIYVGDLPDVERRIGEDVIGLEVREAVVEERVALLDLAFDPADGDVEANL